MIQTQTTKNEPTSIIQEVRKWKEDHAAQYGFDIRAIGQALREAQQAHPDRVVSHEKKPEQGGASDA